MQKYFFYSTLVGLMVVGFAFSVSAASVFDIQFPIPELGNCADQAACKVYCDDATHLDACFQFAQQHSLVSKDNAQQLQQSGLLSGPGGCKGQDACRKYCDDASHSDDCLSFAEKNGFISHSDAQKTRTLINQTGPGGCKGQDACKQYCDDASHADECLQFAEQKGFISKQQATQAKKFLTATQKQGGPGGCQGSQCQQYCQDPGHQDECFQFAKDNGLVSQQDQQNFDSIKKIQQTVEQNGGPGGCKSGDECRAYCTDPAHVEECVAFGVAHGNMSETQVRQKLQDFATHTLQINNPQNGITSSQDLQNLQQQQLQKFEEFKQLEQQFRGQQSFSSTPPPGITPGLTPGQEGAQDQNQHTSVGPGGCASPQECIQYCTQNKEECFGGNQSQLQQKSQGAIENQVQAPQLRTNLLRTLNTNDLPQQFQQLPPEQRKQFFQEKFGQPSVRQDNQGDQGNGQKGEPSVPVQQQPNGFPAKGVPQFPSGVNTQQFRGLSPQQIPVGQPQTFPPQFKNQTSPSDFQQGSGGFSPPSSGSAFQPPSGNFAPPPTGSAPPSGFTQPPSGGFMTQPSGASPPSSGSFSPPPSGSAPPPSGSSMPPPPPSSYVQFEKVFGAILTPFIR